MPMASTQTGPERENVAAVARAFDAFAAGDAATLAATFHPEACWRVAATGVLKGNYRGRDQILGFFAHLAHETDGTFRSIPVTLAAAGDRVFSQNVTSATRNGRAFVWDVVLVFEFAGGLATVVQQYVLDHAALRRFWL
jgi:ketosteroid isomerase-like protein